MRKCLVLIETEDNKIIVANGPVKTMGKDIAHLIMTAIKDKKDFVQITIRPNLEAIGEN